MPTALVTGASGFTGRYMIDVLKKRGFTVAGLGSEPTNADETLACDLTDAAAVRAAVDKTQPDWVVHLAALAFVGHTDQEAFYRVNVFGTLNLLAALAEQKKAPQRILVASSANIYGTPGIEVINEDVCPAPVNHYACSKLAMEHMVATWFERLPIVMARPFNYTGPGQDERFLIPKIVGHFARNEATIELGNLDVSRDFSDVRDVVEAYARLLESDVRGERVNICSGRAIALREIISQMEDIAGYRIKVEVNPAFVRANEIPVLRGDNRRLQAATGFAPRQDLQQTLEDMLQAARAN
ncbi:GDP-mannose 4,6-dehydratase [Pseudomonas sp. ZM23]|uniref:GDP-mannose 4,6-dehydratase n=1 Tax=Pseudomonas triclosanedens TaxID=2961893 RepID=A0ABY6ZY88_9PSED|nr:GDP-mannose 4,6-dehydratase [Pseudomonas triclosanedens]MCP8466746.1 GDP-mannose 4,6-dehydratase [Pseudomonas triclosanedens]MCP8469970.1 GDP-mannose 4,6-dehydratase [Pseudomonas triclosanedens]MCP8477880.1 GDP-mannose 4,6-dehydratase [Pseudomonas triclosanedens]WAI49301.1 GDP-mannose 4,6-dehydratase [Pseudomonas triclosanedens]